jgi:hypothetical protein
MADSTQGAGGDPVGTEPIASSDVVAKCELALMLRDLGATDADLASIRFFKFNPELPFSSWPITGPEWLVLKHHGLCKAYCAFRWLTLDDPPSSRNKDDAWTYIGQILAAPVYQLGLETSENQKKRAARPRVAKGDFGEIAQ